MTEGELMQWVADWSSASDDRRVEVRCMRRPSGKLLWTARLAWRDPDGVDRHDELWVTGEGIDMADALHGAVQGYCSERESVRELSPRGDSAQTPPTNGASNHAQTLDEEETQLVDAIRAHTTLKVIVTANVVFFDYLNLRGEVCERPVKFDPREREGRLHALRTALRYARLDHMPVMP